jgi:uncharacterized hydrophobic protein (TIGR00271 family)
MKIIESDVRGATVWRILLILAPNESLGMSWQFGLKLARANNGELVTAVVIPNESTNNLEAAQTAVDHIKAAAQPVNSSKALIAADLHGTRDVESLVQTIGVDLLLVRAESHLWQNGHGLDNVSCAVAVIRGDRPLAENGENGVGNGRQRILIPTSSGPNSAHALRLLLPLATNNDVTAFFVANAAHDHNQEALGWARLREALQFVGGSERIQRKVVTRPSVTEGIVEEAVAYDWVLLGASQESRLDKVLFGDIPAAVVRFSQTPVIILRQPRNRLSYLAGKAAWQLRNLLPRMKESQRAKTYVRIRRSARPNRQFFILITLSAMIAALGLLVNSPAVVIGAMLVAPLMSPIVGSGMAVVLGDARFLRLSLGAVSRGVLLAIGVGALSGLLHLGQPLTGELLARTAPTLLDLAIALFSGLAGAYALSNSDAAGALPGVAIAAALVPPLATVGICLTTGHEREALGALLLFATNFVAISSATALVFLTLGFRPKVAKRERHSARARSVRVAMVLLAIIVTLLTITTYRLAHDSRMEAEIRSVIYQSVSDVADAELDSLLIEGETTTDGAPLQMALVVRSTETIPHETVLALQERIGIRLQREVGLTLTVILVTELDPVVPPTLTPTATATATKTPGPTPTAGPTRTFTPTATQPVLILPSATITPTVEITATVTLTATAVPPTQPPPPEPKATDTPLPPPTQVVTATLGPSVTPNPTGTTAPVVTETAVPTSTTQPQPTAAATDALLPTATVPPSESTKAVLPTPEPVPSATPIP